MPRFAACVSLIVTFFLGINQNAMASIGGECLYRDYQLLTSVKNIDGERIQLLTESSRYPQTTVSKSKFRSPIEKNQFYWLEIREHISGGCSPFDKRRVIKLDSGSVNLVPGPDRLYQSMIALAGLRICASHSEENLCVDSDNDFSRLSDSQIVELKKIVPKTVKICSFESINKIMEKIESLNKATSFIACVLTEEGEERIVQLATEKAKSIPVRFINIREFNISTNDYLK